MVFTSHKYIVWPQKSGIKFLDDFYGTFPFPFITLGDCQSLLHRQEQQGHSTRHLYSIQERTSFMFETALMLVEQLL